MNFIIPVLAFHVAILSSFPEYKEEFPIHDALTYEVVTGFEAWDLIGATIATNSGFMFTLHAPPFQIHKDYTVDVYLDHWGFRAGFSMTYRAEYDQAIWEARQYNTALYIGFDSRNADWWRK